MIDGQTVAFNPNAMPLVRYDDRIVLVGVEARTITAKTVTDRCPDCTATQFDNYTDAIGCERNSVLSLGHFVTILLR